MLQVQPAANRHTLMNFFDSPLRRKILFGCLYLSEGAPIGYLWLALPTQLRASGVAVVEITWLTAMLVVPWTFKFAWAPLIDVLRGPHWTLRHWIVASQCVMGVTLAPLIWLEPAESFRVVAAFLMVHAFSAATQDVAIDALCISATAPGERGEYNGWMQAGMLLGRAMMGGGALVLSASTGGWVIVAILILLTVFSALLLVMSRPPSEDVSHNRANVVALIQALQSVVADAATWYGLAFGVLGGAAAKSLDIIYGPYLIDRGLTEESIGWFSLGPKIGLMIVGSLLGGWLADRVGKRQCVAISLVFISFTVSALAISDRLLGAESTTPLLGWLGASALGIGLFTSSSYALFMNICHPRIAATQFSAFMGATNACEFWSGLLAGQIIGNFGYSPAMLIMGIASLFALPLVWKMQRQSVAGL